MRSIELHNIYPPKIKDLGKIINRMRFWLHSDDSWAALDDSGTYSGDSVSYLAHSTIFVPNRVDIPVAILTFLAVFGAFGPHSRYSGRIRLDSGLFGLAFGFFRDFRY